MLTFDGVWHFGEVFFSQMNPGFHCAGQMADSVHGIVWVSGLLMSVNVVDRVAHGGGGVMVWAGVCYGQRTQVNFIDGILNAQRYRDKIRRPIVVPFIHDHHLTLHHDNATHVRWMIISANFDLQRDIDIYIYRYIYIYIYIYI